MPHPAPALRLDRAPRSEAGALFRRSAAPWGSTRKPRRLTPLTSRSHTTVPDGESSSTAFISPATAAISPSTHSPMSALVSYSRPSMKRVVLGQNVSSYRDPDGKKSFAELLVGVASVNGTRRVRFMTSHPRDFGRDIVEAIDTVPALCDHVHLPVQSGSTRVLDAMQRLYNRDEYLERIGWIRGAKRDISITTDLIVGFPGESEREFEQTLSLLDEVGYDSAFTFKYSPRPNTPSLRLDDAIPDAEKARRLAVVNEKQRQISVQRNKRHLGQIVEAMVEGKNDARNQWIGRTSQIKVLNFTAPEGRSVQSWQLCQCARHKHLSEQPGGRDGKHERSVICD